MERVCRRIACVLGLLIASCLCVFSQDSGKWIRIQSDNGEFSIEIPESNNALYDKEGYSLSDARASRDHDLREMRMVNAYFADTYLSVETYRASKGALKTIQEIDERERADAESSTIDRGTYSIDQLNVKVGTNQMLRQYLRSKNYIYVLTAAARSAETPAMRRFFESLLFDPDAKSNVDPRALKMSTLPLAKITIEQDLNKATAASTPAIPKKIADSGNVSSLVILSKPRASYTPEARSGGVRGKVRLKITLSDKGFVPKILVVGEGLGGGITRQAIFAALRIKFLPKLVDSKPVPTVVTFEYGFEIY